MSRSKLPIRSPTPGAEYKSVGAGWENNLRGRTKSRGAPLDLQKPLSAKMRATADRLSVSPPRRRRVIGEQKQVDAPGQWAGSLRAKSSADKAKASPELNREISARAHSITERLSHSPQRFSVADDSHAANLKSYKSTLRSDAVGSGTRLATGKSEIPGLDELPGPREGIYGNKRHAKAKVVADLTSLEYESRALSPSSTARARAAKGLASRRNTSASSLNSSFNSGRHSRSGGGGGDDPSSNNREIDAQVSIPDLMQFMAAEGVTEAEMAPIVQSLAKLHVLRSNKKQGESTETTEHTNVDYALPESPTLTRAAVGELNWAKVADAGTGPIRFPPDYGGFRGGRRRMTEL